MSSNKRSALRMSECDKQQTYQAAMIAMGIINKKREALNNYRQEVYTNFDKYEGSFTFTFNMDFMKVTHKLILGYMQQRFTNGKKRQLQVTVESLKIAQETGASYQEVRELFLLLLSKYIIS